MQFGWALLGCGTQISPPSPGVVGVWNGRETREKMRGEKRREGREEKMRQEGSDKVVK